MLWSFLAIIALLVVGYLAFVSFYPSFGGDVNEERQQKREIGEKYGPFDLALIECGQYNESWSTIHMMPEETAQAGADLCAK